jgi:hypothetical protein
LGHVAATLDRVVEPPRAVSAATSLGRSSIELSIRMPEPEVTIETTGELTRQASGKLKRFIPL